MSTSPLVDVTGGELLAALGDLSAGQRETGFSTCFSNLSMVTGPRPGLAQAHLGYNRRCRVLEPFLELPGQVLSHSAGPLAIEQHCDRGRFAFAFAGCDAWLATCQGWDDLTVGLQVAGMRLVRISEPAPGTWRWDALLPNPDPRDPDPFVPVALVWRVLRGTACVEGERLSVCAEGSGIVLAGALAVLDVAEQTLLARLDAVPGDEAAVVVRARAWWDAAVGPLVLHQVEADEARFLAGAVHSLLSNAVQAPGLLADGVAVYPSRGRYPAQYLWDSCFHTLGLAELAPGLALDSLRLLAVNRRVDGKIGHFVCATWLRPGLSQPPLLGWALGRLLGRDWDAAVAREFLPALIANNTWWQTQRLDRVGLIACEHPMETGWDDTARFDEGPIVAMDMNAYLIEQLRVTADLASRLGEDATAATATRQADALRERLRALCWDAGEGIFRDLHSADGSPVAVASPAGLLPIWAGVLDHDAPAARRAVQRWLLPPGPLAGPVPFPSVDPRHPSYVPRNPGEAHPHSLGACWRGPAWPPLSWLMLETLDRVGCVAEADSAARRLYEVLRRDGHCCEFLDAETGTGLGAPAQGWTAAIALALQDRLRRTR